MPLISMVIPVFKVQAFLEECLDSVLNQGFDDLEVIAINDCSPDHCGRILDERAARDGRLTILHLEENIGLGPARNRGLAMATGDYVMFLDSDDVMTPGSLVAIAAKLEAMQWPEMLILDHARTYWWGKVQRNIRHDVLLGLSSAPFTAGGHPEIFELLNVAWNKVSKREFLLREGLEFPAGYYEDTPWTYQGLLTARSIAALPVVAVHYRQRRHGSILGTTSSRHSEAFEQWERVFAFLDRRPDLDHWRALVSERMAHHYLTVLRHPDRLSHLDRNDFFRRASRHMQLFAPTPPALVSRHTDAMLKICLYRNNLPAFDAVRAAKSVVNKARFHRLHTSKSARKLGARAKAKARAMEYKRTLAAPLDPNLTVFASYWNRGVMGNPESIYRATRQLAPEMRCVWVIRRDQQRNVPPGIDFVTPGTRRYWRLMGSATYFVNDVNFPDSVVKRLGQIHIQTQHGTPLKHMGLDLMQHPAASHGMGFRKLLERSDRWDYNLSANRFSTVVWEKAFPSNFTSVESGYPRNDVLVNATKADVADARRELGIPEGKIAVLYAPTHRDHDKHFILRANLKQLGEDLGPDFVILVRAHYFYEWLPELTGPARDGLLLNVSRFPSVEKLMLASDVLVTDYSSIMFDYANLDRPIVIFAPDLPTYQAVRGVYFDLEAKSPGPFTTEQGALAKVLTSGEYDGPESITARAAFREEFCQFDDGIAAERVVRALILGQPLLPVTPLAQRTSPPRPAAAIGLSTRTSRVALGATMNDELLEFEAEMDLEAQVREQEEDVVASIDALNRADVLEPDPGLLLVEPEPTKIEARSSVSWESSDTPDGTSVLVRVTTDPEQTT
jgi:CDP-glycerol glycerophosphotransferase (TagB/SpsB family)/glycosyltransferase involved in cell wall biosynthesis